MKPVQQFQIGKNGLTEGVIESLKLKFVNYEQVRVSVLKSAGHDKKKVEEIAEEIVNQLGKNYTYRVIGFTIILKKWRKARR